MKEINFVFLQCVFHSIRFKVNKRLEYSGTPFLCLHLIGKWLNVFGKREFGNIQKCHFAFLCASGFLRLMICKNEVSIKILFGVCLCIYCLAWVGMTIFRRLLSVESKLNSRICYIT